MHAGTLKTCLFVVPERKEEMKKLLYCVEELPGEKPRLIESRLLVESEVLKWKVFDNPPEIEDRPGEIGKYYITEQGEIAVRYEQREKTEAEKLKEEIKEIRKEQLDMMEALAEIKEGGA